LDCGGLTLLSSTRHVASFQSTALRIHGNNDKKLSQKSFNDFLKTVVTS
jgi:hypothetical protein